MLIESTEIKDMINRFKCNIVSDKNSAVYQAMVLSYETVVKAIELLEEHEGSLIAKELEPQDLSDPFDKSEREYFDDGTEDIMDDDSADELEKEREAEDDAVL